MRAFFILCAFFLSDCGGGFCGVEPLDERFSPNGVYVATVFERNCGATAPYIRVVSIHHVGSEFTLEDDDDWVFTIHGQPSVQVSWKNNTELQISYSATGDTPTQRTKWEKVTVSYQ